MASSMRGILNLFGKAKKEKKTHKVKIRGDS